MDVELLLWVNQTLGRTSLDPLFELLSAKLTFSIPLLGLFCVYLGLRYKQDGWKLAGLLILVVIVGDIFGNFLKDLFAQPRPCQDYASQLRGLGDTVFYQCGVSESGMPSNHALNFFATFAFLSVLLPKTRIWLPLLILASLVGLSRIYLGSHFPSQVLAGAVIGSIFGGGVAFLLSRKCQFARRVHAEATQSA